MKILHLAYSDNNGPGKAALRLHQAMNEAGIESHFLVRQGTYSSLHQKNLTSQKNLVQKGLWEIIKIFSEIFDRLQVGLYTKELLSSVFVPDFFGALQKQIKKINPDLIYLHSINHGYASEKLFVKLGIPTIWVLHSSFAFCGGCHFLNMDTCEKFKKKCTSCPVAKGLFGKMFIARQFQKRKKYLLAKKSPFIGAIAPSEYMHRLASTSLLYGQKPLATIANTTPTNIYRPIDKSVARDLLNLNTKGPILAFGAVSINEPRKGYKTLIKALQMLPEKKQKDITLVLFGQNLMDKHEHHFCFNVVSFGTIHSDVELSLLYNAVDLVVLPSKQDNLPNVMMESLACTTPVVSFNHGGMAHVLPQIDPLLVCQNDESASLFEKIDFFLKNPQKKEEIGQKAREYILANASASPTIAQHQKFWKEIGLS